MQVAGPQTCGILHQAIDQHDDFETLCGHFRLEIIDGVAHANSFPAVTKLQSLRYGLKSAAATVLRTSPSFNRVFNCWPLLVSFAARKTFPVCASVVMEYPRPSTCSGPSRRNRASNPPNLFLNSSNR